eukprot:747574-Hanusia_phi.AAC.17
MSVQRTAILIDTLELLDLHGSDDEEQHTRTRSLVARLQLPAPDRIPQRDGDALCPLGGAQRFRRFETPSYQPDHLLTLMMHLDDRQ